ncbi:hypothetical protein K503DRAFT_497104 [Rhizopogon vinicolor AM-OR11-026]|uniref:Uncharacterized protein n=1 Tax=Rhizopogon vinicolor AM-OR11-026 TaxID=1314800 RepID=A0A1B7MM78_9AGAM|nr:hypothetical protein K503DRAFT_497104 [Rhizopogon vinicolor AM-OR11-026]
MDGTEIRLFGILRLTKRTTNVQVAAFPIDKERVTFGCDPACSIVVPSYCSSPLSRHQCHTRKIVFQKRKAFLIILGEHMRLVFMDVRFPRIALDLHTDPFVLCRTRCRLHYESLYFVFCKCCIISLSLYIKHGTSATR